MGLLKKSERENLFMCRGRILCDPRFSRLHDTGRIICGPYKTIAPFRPCSSFRRMPESGRAATEGRPYESKGNCI